MAGVREVWYQRGGWRAEQRDQKHHETDEALRWWASRDGALWLEKAHLARAKLTNTAIVNLTRAHEGRKYLRDIVLQ